MAKKPKKSKRFRYALETVRRVRKIREDQEQEKFQEAERKVIEEQKKEFKLKEEQKIAYATLRERMMTSEGLTNLGDIQRRKLHLDNLKIKIEEQIQIRKEAEKKRDEQREILIKAVKDRKIMDRDKEKKREQWKKFMEKEESKFIDDIATVGFVRRKKLAEAELPKTPEASPDL